MEIGATAERLRVTEQLVLLFANPHLGPIIIRFFESEGQGQEQLTSLSRTIASLLDNSPHLSTVVFQGLISDSVDKCPSPELLFRGDALAPRIMKEYLVNTAQLFFIHLLRKDVTKLLLSKKVMNNAQIIKPAQSVLDKICNPGLPLPPCMVTLCAVIARVVATKFPDQERPALAGTIFLRFICPMLIQPRLFLSGVPGANVKNVVHLARLLQSLANNTADPSTSAQYEKFFTPVNEQKMSAFLSSLVDRPAEEEQPSPSSLIDASPSSTSPTLAVPELPRLDPDRAVIWEVLPISTAIKPQPTAMDSADLMQLLNMFYSLSIRVRIAIKGSKQATPDMTKQLLAEWDVICQHTRIVVSDLSFSNSRSSQQQTATSSQAGIPGITRSTSVPQADWPASKPLGSPPAPVLPPSKDLSKSLRSHCSDRSSEVSSSIGDASQFKFFSIPTSSSLAAKRDAAIRAWTVDQVVEWLECNDLAVLSPHFQDNRIDGQVLLSQKNSASLTPTDTKLGIRKAFVRCHQHLCRSVIDPMDDSAFGSVEEQMMALKEHLIRQSNSSGMASVPIF